MKFDCTKCGACCAPTPPPGGGPYPIGRGYVQLEPDDIKRLTKLRLSIVSEVRFGYWINTKADTTGRAVCSALDGEIGKSCSCSIYKQRPYMCRSFENGGAQCLDARAEAGLPREAAYVVQSRDEEHAHIVYAENGNKARRAVVGLDGFDEYIELRCRRAPEFDNKRPTDEELCRNHGWHFECHGCWRHVNQYDLDEGAKFINDDAWCAKCIAEEKVA